MWNKTIRDFLFPLIHKFIDLVKENLVSVGYHMISRAIWQGCALTKIEGSLSALKHYNLGCPAYDLHEKFEIF